MTQDAGTASSIHRTPGPCTILAHAEEEIVLRHLGFAYGLVDRQIPCLHVTVETDGLQTVNNCARLELGGDVCTSDALSHTYL
jgi:hypothetical protein